jgi:PKD repeat protein
MKPKQKMTAFLLAFLLTGFCIQTGSAQNTCQAAYYWSQLHPNQVGFTSHPSTGITANTTFLWNFGNGTTVSGINANVVYNAPGTYIVCLTISDSLGHCSSTFCDSIHVYGTIICNLVSDSLNGNTSCLTCADGYASVGSVQGGSAPYSYSWTGLQGNTNQQVGLTAGTYSVCITDKNQCQICKSITVNAGGNNCHANFSSVQTAPNTIAFTDLSSGMNPNTAHYYDFGDGTSGYSTANATHIYSAPGMYLACLRIGDSLNTGTTCSSSFCDTVRVTGSLICNLHLNANTYAPSCPHCSDGMAYIFNVYSGKAPFTYAWSNGSTADSAFNLSPGKYTVCVTDANSCHVCDTVYIPLNNNACLASFSHIVFASNTVSFTNTSTSNNQFGTTYYWTFGDGNSAIGAHVSHVYAGSGTYTTCLYLSDSTSSGGTCSSTFCDSVVIGASGLCNWGVHVFSSAASCSSCHDGSAGVSPLGGTAPFTYYMPGLNIIPDSSGIFHGLLPGIYTLCVRDANGCVVCAQDTVGFPGSVHCSAYFVLQADSAHPGNYTATNLSTGNGQLNYSWNWGDNTGDSIPTPVHTYASAGLYTICLSIYDATGCSSTYCDTLAASRLPAGMAGGHTTVNVVNGISAGITEHPTLSGWNMYPNPSSGETTIAYTLSQNADVSISLYDLVGREVVPAEKISNQIAGAHEMKLEASALQPGIYLVRLIAGGKSETKRLFVIK